MQVPCNPDSAGRMQNIVSASEKKRIQGFFGLSWSMVGVQEELANERGVDLSSQDLISIAK